MREFNFTWRFPASPVETFDVTTRDFEGLEKYIPNIASIQVRERADMEDGRVRFLLRFSGEGAIPSIARPVIRPDMVRWDEELLCDRRNLNVAWSLRSSYFTEHFHCRGITHFHDNGNGTRIELNGRLNITMNSLPGFPDALVQRAVMVIEPFLVKIAEVNLGKFYDACRRRLRDEQRRA